MAAKNLSISELKRELARRETRLSTLEAKRKKLQKQMDQLDAEIGSLSGSGRAARGKPGPRKGRRPGRPAKNGRRKGGKRAKNKMNLPDAIASAMQKGAVVSPKEVAALVKKNGYKTTSKTFGVQVATALANDKRFKRIGRGQYERVK